MTPRHKHRNHNAPNLMDWAPDSGTLLVSTIIGLLAFVGVLLYGPTPAQPPHPTPTVDQIRPWVRSNAIRAVGQGQDRRAIDELLEHLKTDPGFGWGWRIVYQLASRDEALADRRELAASRLSELTRRESYDEEWTWDRRTRGVIFMLEGRTDEARATLARGIQRVKDDRNIDIGLASFLEAAMLAIGDQPDRALHALERAVEEENYLNSNWLLATPDLDSLRGDPRLAVIIARSQELEQGPIAQTPAGRPTGRPPPFPTPLDETADDAPGEATDDETGG